MDNIEERLRKINIEDFIWIVYIGIIILSFYANMIERRYFIFNNEKDLKQYRKIMFIIFLILVIIYFYVVIDSYKDIKNNKTFFHYLSFFASILVLISGIIYFIIIIYDENINVEIAFN